MKTEENIKNDEQEHGTIQETPGEETEGGLKVKTNVKAGPGVIIGD